MARRRPLRWAAPARTDLIEAHAYLRLENPGAARKFATSIRDAAKRLREHPRLCAPFEAAPLLGEFRSAVVGRHRLIYRLDRDAVVVFRVWDCRRDPDRMWKP